MKIETMEFAMEIAVERKQSWSEAGEYLISQATVADNAEARWEYLDARFSEYTSEEIREMGEYLIRCDEQDSYEDMVFINFDGATADWVYFNPDSSVPEWVICSLTKYNVLAACEDPRFPDQYEDCLCSEGRCTYEVFDPFDPYDVGKMKSRADYITGIKPDSKYSLDSFLVDWANNVEFRIDTEYEIIPIDSVCKLFE